MSKLDKNVHTTMDLAYTQINTSIDELTAGIYTAYKHTRGDSENAGNSTYSQKGVGIAIKTTQQISFNCLTANIGLISSGTAIIKLYTSSSLPNSTFDISTLTQIFSGSFSNLLYNNNTIDLGINNIITVAANTYVWLVIYSSEVSVTVNSKIAIWNINPSSDRIPIILSTSSTPSTGNWSLGNLPSFGSASFTLIQRIYNDIAQQFTNDYAQFQVDKAALDSKIVPNIQLPSNIYIPIGKELNLWHNNIVNDVLEKGNYYVDISVSPTPTASGTDNIFYNKERCLRFKPTTVGTYGLTITVLDKDTSTLATKAVTVKAVSNNGKTGTKTILVIGDSLVNNCQIPTALNAYLSEPSDITTNFIGTKGTVPNLNEGIPGWTYANFIGSSSPFYISGALNFSQYLINNSFSAPDFICINLGINESFGNRLSSANLTTIVDNAKTLIIALLAGTPNAKIILCLPTSCCISKDAFATNYGAGFNKITYMLNIRDIHSYFVTAFDNNAYNANVYLADTGYRVDRINSYPSETVAISDYNTATEFKYNNAVHPTVVGGKEIAMSYAGVIRSLM